MIRLSRIADYGIVLMAHLAERDQRAPGTTHNAREVAAATQLPAPVVSKVLKSLAREGLLDSQRGAKGGYSLARSPEQIGVPEIIAALDGPLGLTECTIHPGSCIQETNCSVREPWQRINHAVQQTLARISLADLVNTRAPDPIVPLDSLGVDATGIETPAR